MHLKIIGKVLSTTFLCTRVNEITFLKSLLSSFIAVKIQIGFYGTTLVKQLDFALIQHVSLKLNAESRQQPSSS